MKKGLLVILVLALVANGYTYARMTRDNNGNLVNSATLRSEKRRALEQEMLQRKMRAAAAAKINYDNKIEETQQTNNKPTAVKLKSNFYQSVNKNNDMTEEK